jgi:hypothetical protein
MSTLVRIPVVSKALFGVGLGVTHRTELVSPRWQENKQGSESVGTRQARAPPRRGETHRCPCGNPQLWSGRGRPRSHMTSMLRPASRSNRRLDWTRLSSRRYRASSALMDDMPAGRSPQVQPRRTQGRSDPINKSVDDANRIVFANPVLQAFRKQRALAAILALKKKRFTFWH